MEACTSAAAAPTESAVGPLSQHGVAAAGVDKTGDSCCNGQAAPAAKQQQAAASCSTQAAGCNEVLHPQLHAQCDAAQSGNVNAARHNPMQPSSAHADGQLSAPADRWCEQQYEPLQSSQQQQSGQAAQQSRQQQQQQQSGQAPEDGDAMGALIAAVLGCGPRGRAQLARHQERMEQQQQQQQSKACVQPQAPVPKQQPAPANLADLQAELDNLLGLSPTRGGQAAVARSRADAEVLAAECSSRELAPANAELAAAAVERARVARTCPSTDISCSSACNRSSPGKLGSRGSSSSTVQDKDSKPPWKPSSPRLPSSHGQNQQQQQQEWKQWQQSPAPVSSGSPSKGRARTPSPARHHGWQAQQQQQQAPELPVLACVRCGQQEGDNMGPCCFHPGLVAAPGPLMYGQEWHACR